MRDVHDASALRPAALLAHLRAASCSGPIISVSGVRNSWTTFEKNAVFARSSSASASARRRSSSIACASASADASLRRDEAEERSIVLVERAHRAHGGDEDRARMFLTRQQNRQHHALCAGTFHAPVGSAPKSCGSSCTNRGLTRPSHRAERPRVERAVVQRDRFRRRIGADERFRQRPSTARSTRARRRDRSTRTGRREDWRREPTRRPG